MRFPSVYAVVLVFSFYLGIWILYALGLLILFSFITRNLSNGRLTSERILHILLEMTKPYNDIFFVFFEYCARRT